MSLALEGPIAALGPIAMGLMGPIAASLGRVRSPMVWWPFGAGLCRLGRDLVVAGVKPDSASAGILHRYVPLHHGGEEPPWEDFPPKGLRLLGVDDAVVVGDGLDGVVRRRGR